MRRGPWNIIAGLTCLAAAVLAGVVVAAETKPPAPSATAPEPLHYRRAYAPADRIGDWPHGTTKYLPIAQDEFERLLAAANLAAPDLRPASSARIAAAEYQARLNGTHLTAGTAKLRVEVSSKTPATLSMEPCTLAIQSVRGEAADAAAPILGLGADGKLAVLAGKSENLDLTWSLAGRAESGDGAVFDLQVPPCTVNTFTIDAPEGLVITSDRGMSHKLGFVDEGVQRWQIDLGGYNCFELKAIPVGKTLVRQRLATVIQSTLYDISPQGIEVSCRWKLDVHHEPLRSLALRMDGGLQIIGVSRGDQVLPLTIKKTPEGEREAVIAFPDPVEEDGCIVEIKALCPMELDRPQRLPRIRPLDVFWQEGEAEVAVHAPLGTEALVPADAIQTGAAPLPAPAVGQSYRFQFFSPDAAIDATLAMQKPAIAVTSATSVECGLSAATARSVAEVRSTVGDHFAIDADVGDNWLIDSVESQPAEAIEDWSVEQIDGKPRLTIRFTMPVTPQRPVRLVAVAKRPGSMLEQRFSPASLMPLVIRAATSQRLLALRAIAPCRLRLSGGEGFVPTDPHALDAIQREILSDAPRDVLMEISPQSAGVQIGVAAQQPAYAANIQLDASVHDDALEERYVIRCRPESGAVDRLQVAFTTQRDQVPRWTLSNRPQTPLAASRVPDARAETWEVILPEPTSEPFDLCVARRTPREKSVAISLAGLPEAASQRATVAIRWLSAVKPKVVNYRLQSIPSDPAADGRNLRLLGIYRYDPVLETALAQSRETEEAAPPALLLTPGEAKATAFVWSLEMESWFGYDGAARHTATFRMQNSGLDAMRIDLPSDCIADSADAQIDGRGKVFRLQEDSAGRTLPIQLDADRRFTTVTVRFATPLHGLHTVGRFTPPDLRTDLPVLAKTWTAWLPPDFAWYGGNRRYLAVEPPVETAVQRMFGPLGRDNSEPACNPFKPATWAPSMARQRVRQSSLQTTEQWLQSLGALMKAEGSDTVWADLLAHSPAASMPLVIDRTALARLGISPQTAVLAARSAAVPNRAIEAVQSVGLALIVHPHAVLLTGQVEAALWQGWLQDGPRGGIWWIDSGPLAEQIEQATGGGDRMFAVADTWRRQLPEAKSVWDIEPAGATDATSGWSAVRTAVAGEEPICLCYADFGVMRLLGIAAFGVMLALGLRLAQRRRLLGAAACVAAAAALVVPVPFLPAATGALLGLAVSLALGMLRKAAAPAPIPVAEKESSSTFSVGLPTTTAILLLCAATLLPPSVCGEEPPAQRGVYQVFIPVDENQQPTADKYQISEDFFRELYRRAQVSAEAPHGWILGGASYRGELVKDVAGDHYRIDHLTAGFDLFVMSPKTRVRIPFHREGANLAAEGALLDGENIQVDWEPDGNALVFEAETAGACRLELVLRGVGLTDGFEASIPQLASSSLELTVPPGAPNIDVPSALGDVGWKAAPRRFTAALGPTDRLSIRWGNGGSVSGPAQAIDVEQLQWMHVLPGSVSIDVQWKIKVVDGPFRQMQIATDPRLRLLPLAGENSPQCTIRSIGPQSQSIVLSWPAAVRDETVVEARFLLPGVSGVGVIRAPQIDVLDARTTRRMLAVSVDPALDYEQVSADRTEPVTPADFSAAWGESAAAPSLALRPAAGEAFWRLTTHPREARTTVDQTLAVAYGQDCAHLFYEAQLTTPTGSHFQLAIAVPPQLEIDRISLLVDGMERVAHWSRNANGEIHVFLKEAASLRQSLSLRGRMPAAIDGPQPLPDIRVEKCQLLSSVIQVFRLGGILATVAPGPELSPIDTPIPPPVQAELGRLVQAFRVNPAAKMQSTVRLTANQPKLRTEEVVWLRRSTDAWTAQCDSRLHVEGGELDDLRIEAPLNFAGPLRLSAGISARVLSTAGDARMLVIHPEAAIHGEAFLSVSGVLGPSTGDRFTAPQFVPQQAEASRRLLALPKLLNGRPVAWDTIGMRPAELPADFPQPGDIASFDIYEVYEEPCKAVLNVSDQSLGAAKVRLCDITAAWQGDGSVRGAAVFDVDPGKALDCPLWLPRGVHAVFCSVAGIAVEPVPEPGGALTIPLAMARLPQRVEVVFEGKPPEDASPAVRLDAPMLGDLPVDQTLWTVIGPPSCAWAVSDGGEAVAAWQMEMARFKSAAAVAQSAAAQSNIAAEDLGNWYQAHAAKLAATRRSAERLLSDAPRKQAVRMARLEVRTIDQEQTQLAERLGTLSTLTRANEALATGDTPDELLGRSLDPALSRLFLSARGRVDSVRLNAISTRAGNASIDRTLGALAAIVAACLLLFAGRNMLAWPLRILRHRLNLAGMAAGLAWWLWLWPSWLGWLIVAACVVRSLRPGRRVLLTPDPSSHSASSSAVPQADSTSSVS